MDLFGFFRSIATVEILLLAECKYDVSDVAAVSSRNKYDEGVPMNFGWHANRVTFKCERERTEFAKNA